MINVFYPAPDMIICSKNVSIRADCIKNSIGHLLPLLKDGFPPLDFPSLDPFYVNTTYIEYDQGFLTSKLNISNIKMSGVSSAEVKVVRTKMNSTNLYVLFTLYFPLINIETDYMGTTRFNDLTVHSEGRAVVDCCMLYMIFNDK